MQQRDTRRMRCWVMTDNQCATGAMSVMVAVSVAPHDACDNRDGRDERNSIDFRSREQ